MNSTSLCPWSIAAFSKGLYVRDVRKIWCLVNEASEAEDSQLEDITEKSSISGAAYDFQKMTPFVNEACNPIWHGSEVGRSSCRWNVVCRILQSISLNLYLVGTCAPKLASHLVRRQDATLTDGEECKHASKAVYASRGHISLQECWNTGTCRASVSEAHVFLGKDQSSCWISWHCTQGSLVNFHGFHGVSTPWEPTYNFC